MGAAGFQDGQAGLRDFLRALDESFVRFFPVRHHSPACAWHLRELVRRERFSSVLVEGPEDITPLIPFILDGRTRAPFAVYTTYVDREGARKENYNLPKKVRHAKPKACLRTGALEA